MTGVDSGVSGTPACDGASDAPWELALEAAAAGDVKHTRNSLCFERCFSPCASIVSETNACEHWKHRTSCKSVLRECISCDRDHITVRLMEILCDAYRAIVIT